MKRNYGIDLLRMLLMFMVVILHVLRHGGILEASETQAGHYVAASFINTLAVCAVNCYAIITGYVYFNSRYKYASLLCMYIQVWLYSIGIAAVTWILRPHTFTFRALVHFLVPVSRDGYWYFSCYALLFLIIPFLNRAIKASTEQQAKHLLLVLLLFFCVTSVFSYTNSMGINGGLSVLWLIFMYIAGAYIKKFRWFESTRVRKALLVYLGAVLVSWLCCIIYKEISEYTVVDAIVKAPVPSYTAPATIISAVALFVIFKNMNVSPKLNRFISSLAPAAFGVYLIHEHEIIREQLISDNFVFLLNYNIPIMIAGVMIAALGIFAVCLLVDFVRHKIFQWLRIKERLEKLEQKYFHTDLSVVE